MPYLIFVKKINFENSGKTSMIRPKHVLMKNARPSLCGSKHLLALQTLSHCDCIIAAAANRITARCRLLSKLLFPRFCCSCIAFLYKACIKHSPAECNLII